MRNEPHISSLSFFPGAGTSKFFDVKELKDMDASKVILLITCHDTAAGAAARAGERPTVTAPAGVASDRLLSTNEVLLAPPAKLALSKASVTFEVSAAPNADGSVDITLTADATALYVTLTTLAHGRFSDNAFALPTGKATVQFIPFGDLDVPTLKASLRVEHAQQALE